MKLAGWLAAALLWTCPLAAQELPPAPAEEPPRAGAVLISVDRKVAPPEKVGLYLRTREGEVKKVLECEPYDVKLLRDGGLLVAERWLGRVTLLDRDKQVLFKKEGLVEPVDVEMAPDGTIVVVLRAAGEVIGLDRTSGAVAWRRTGFSSPFDCELLPDGSLVVADSGADRVVVLDPRGQVLRTVTGITFPNTIDVLEGGGMLVTDWSGGHLFEVDPQGKVISRRDLGANVYRAWRRADGMTVVATGDGKLTVYDQRGQVLVTEDLPPGGLVDVEPIDEV